MTRARLINRRRQGDLGEASAIEWLTSRGATVLIPFGQSPHLDLVADLGGSLLRIQVKTSTQQSRTPLGDERRSVSLVTCGGNRSWTGVIKRLDPSEFDYLFALTYDGRRWFIPAAALEARNAISLGGQKYAEYEIEPGRSIEALVHTEESPLESTAASGEYPRGQRTAAVNRQAQPSQVRLLPPPSACLPTAAVKQTNYERKLGKRGQAVINQKRRITIPQKPYFEAGFANASRVSVPPMARAESLSSKSSRRLGHAR